MNNYDLARKSRKLEHANDSWLQSQGIDPAQIINCDYAEDLGRLLLLKPLWPYVVDQDRSQWLSFWYRVYKRNRPLTETHRLCFRNMLKRATRLSQRK